jgi:hypothetical protein
VSSVKYRLEFYIPEDDILDFFPCLRYSFLLGVEQTLGPSAAGRIR